MVAAPQPTLVAERELTRVLVLPPTDRFNHKFHYPYTFLNDEPFSDEFKKYTSGIASGPCSYGLIAPEEWNEPKWINQTQATEARDGMVKAGVIYGGSIPYRYVSCGHGREGAGQLTRGLVSAGGCAGTRAGTSGGTRCWTSSNIIGEWNRTSNTVSREESRARGAELTQSPFKVCDIDYDPFLLMQQRKKKYGFVLTICMSRLALRAFCAFCEGSSCQGCLDEYAETIPTLWDATKGVCGPPSHKALHF